MRIATDQTTLVSTDPETDGPPAPLEIAAGALILPGNPPDDMAQIVPYLCHDYYAAAAAIRFTQRAFGFEIDVAVRHPEEGTVMVAQVRTGSGVILVGPGMDGFGTSAVTDADRVSCMTYVDVEDVDTHFARAKSESTVIPEDIAEHLGGNRQYTPADPQGHRWAFATPVER